MCIGRILCAADDGAGVLAVGWVFVRWKNVAKIRLFAYGVNCRIYRKREIRLPRWYRETPETAFMWYIQGTVDLLSCWHHGMKTFPRFWPFYGNPPVIGDSNHKGTTTHGFGVFCYVRLNNRYIKQWNCRWFEVPWRPCVVTVMCNFRAGMSDKQVSTK